MNKLYRKPTVENKYNLDMKKIRKLKILNREQISAPLFWRNNAISAWCISGSAGTEKDHQFATDTGYWIGIYDEDAKAYAGKVRFSFSTYGGMCGYEFNKFFQPKDIDNENDLKIQEMFLDKINELIDYGILTL